MSVLFWGGGAKRLEVTSLRLLRCHAPAWPGHPVRRGFSAQPQAPRRTGSPGQAGRWHRECGSILPEPRATVSLCDAFPVGF